jgi:hypothetical protein
MTTGKDKGMVPLHVLVPREMKDALEERARADRRSLAETIRIWLEKMLEDEKR